MGVIMLPEPEGRWRVSQGLDESGEPSMISKQRGMTLIGFLIVLSVALFVAYIAMKLVPIYLNHYSVVSSMKSLAAEPDAANMSEARLRDLLSRKFSTSYVKHVNARDIEISLSCKYHCISHEAYWDCDVAGAFRTTPLNQGADARECSSRACGGSLCRAGAPACAVSRGSYRYSWRAVGTCPSK